MSEQTDRERNKAISQLESAANERYLKFWEGQNYSSFDLSVKTISLAISALRAQSEAERKIDRVREYSKPYANDTRKSDGSFLCDPRSAYRNMAKEILEILEGKADV